MASQDIRIVQLEASWSGVGIFPMSDKITLDDTLLEQINQTVITPHRHDHYCCFFLESGYLNFNIDFQNLDIQASSLLVSCPGQVHQLGLAKEIEGWFMAFDAKFINENARTVIEQSFSKVALLHLDHADKAWFINIFNLIYSATNEKKLTNFHHELIQTLINAFFYKTVTIFQSQEDARIQAYSSRSIEIAKNFHQLVKENYFTLKKPADYASKMNITVSYLNDTVKSITGFPSTYFIQNEVFREAQRLLVYTAKTVKEISFQLGYEDYKYFIRLFSKTIGTSPTNFRKKNTV